MHLTNNINNLNIHDEKYIGINQIQVGDGSGLYITHIDTTFFSSTSLKSFVLEIFFVVPQVQIVLS
jgi:hypothetical protein